MSIDPVTTGDWAKIRRADLKAMVDTLEAANADAELIYTAMTGPISAGALAAIHDIITRAAGRILTATRHWRGTKVSK